MHCEKCSKNECELIQNPFEFRYILCLKEIIQNNPKLFDLFHLEDIFYNSASKHLQKTITASGLQTDLKLHVKCTVVTHA